MIGDSKPAYTEPQLTGLLESWNAFGKLSQQEGVRCE